MPAHTAVKPPAGRAANQNPNRRSQRERYAIAGTAARDAVARLQLASAQVIAGGGKPKPSWAQVLLVILDGPQGITSYSRTSDRISIKSLALAACLSPNTVRAALRDLEGMGCITFHTPAATKGQGYRTPGTLIALPMSATRRRDVMGRLDNPAMRFPRAGEGATQTAGGRVQPRLHPPEKYEKKKKSFLALDGIERARGFGSATHSEGYAVASEHLPTPQRTMPPRDMTPEKVKAREALQREIDDRRARNPLGDTPFTVSRGERLAPTEKESGETDKPTPATIRENVRTSWMEDAFLLDYLERSEREHRERSEREHRDELAAPPRGW